MRWFRMYYEARSDAKLRSLSAEAFRLWFQLLCFAAEQEDQRGIIAGYDDELLAVEVADGNTQFLRETIERLKKLRIIREDGDEIVFLNFEKRQYDSPSDHPDRVKERAAKHRAKHSGGPSTPVTARHDDVTPGNALETEIDTDTEREAEAAAAATRSHTHVRESDVSPLETAGGSGSSKTTRTQLVDDELTRELAATLGLDQRSYPVLQTCAQKHLRRLSPPDLRWEAEKLVDQARASPTSSDATQMSVSRFDRWLQNARPQEDSHGSTATSQRASLGDASAWPGGGSPSSHGRAGVYGRPALGTADEWAAPKAETDQRDADLRAKRLSLQQQH